MPKSLISYSVDESRNMTQGLPQNPCLNIFGAFFLKRIVVLISF